MLLETNSSFRGFLERPEVPEKAEETLDLHESVTVVKEPFVWSTGLMNHISAQKLAANKQRPLSVLCVHKALS